MRYMLWLAIILPWAPGLLHGLSLLRIAVLIAIMADGAIPAYRLASIFSLMRVLSGCRGGWLCLCQQGHQSAYQAALMRPAIQPISHLSIYHQVPRYHVGFGSAGVPVSG